MISDVSVGVWGAVSPHQKMKGSPWELSPLDDSFPTIKQALIQIYRHCAVRTHVAAFLFWPVHGKGPGRKKWSSPRIRPSKYDVHFHPIDKTNFMNETNNDCDWVGFFSFFLKKEWRIAKSNDSLFYLFLVYIYMEIFWRE